MTAGRPIGSARFCKAIAKGHTVGSACALVGMAQSLIYALHRRAAGARFALGWRAATLLARQKVCDTLLARAMTGSSDDTAPRPVPRILALGDAFLNSHTSAAVRPLACRCAL